MRVRSPEKEFANGSLMGKGGRGVGPWDEVTSLINEGWNKSVFFFQVKCI